MENDRQSSDRAALALARVEDNREGWLAGRYFELRSHNKTLRNWVGGRGTLWVVVSRPAPRGGRDYSLTFRLVNCEGDEYPEEGRWGKHAVRGDARASEFYPVNDARLLLLSLRFAKGSPISSFKRIGQEIRFPRLLSDQDVALLELYRPPTDVWGAFVSYSHADQEAARKLEAALNGEAVSVFRDTETIRAGKDWKQTIRRGVAACRSLVLLIGESTRESPWVLEELAHARGLGIPVVPVSLTGDLGGFEELGDIQAILDCADWSHVAERIAQAIPTALVASDASTAK